MTSSVWTIIVAGGSGSRFGALKQFEDLCGASVVDRSVATAKAVSAGVVLVAPGGYTQEHGADLVVSGGDSRSASVRAGLAVLPPSAEIVLVHDAARPLATAALYNRVITQVESEMTAVVPTVPLVDSIRRKDGGAEDRDDFEAVQTPQGFPFDLLRTAHESGLAASDDASLVELAGHKVLTIAGEVENFKITTPLDLALARMIYRGDDGDRSRD